MDRERARLHHQDLEAPRARLPRELVLDDRGRLAHLPPCRRDFIAGGGRIEAAALSACASRSRLVEDADGDRRRRVQIAGARRDLLLIVEVLLGASDVRALEEAPVDVRAGRADEHQALDSARAWQAEWRTELLALPERVRAARRQGERGQVLDAAAA